MNIAAVDLFCGVGGLTRGLEEAGIDVVAGVDRDEACKYAYEENNDAEFLQRDVAELSADEIESLYPDDSIRVLAGCAPCQPFSNLNNGEDTRERDDWELLRSIGHLVEDIQPDILVMENVSEIRNHDVYSRFVQDLSRCRYSLWYDRVECQNYGVPQRRRRLVTLASREGNISLVDPTHSATEYQTVRDTIGNGELDPISAGEIHEEDRLHRSRTLNEANLQRIAQSRPGGTWRDWDPELLLECHRKESGRSYDSVYGRMEWDAPAPTMTTQFYNYGSGRFGHPDQDRAISLREGAMLQTFPKDYEFVPEDEDVQFKSVGRFIGNAVPVRLGEVIGQSIREHVEVVDVAA